MSSDSFDIVHLVRRAQHTRVFVSSFLLSSLFKAVMRFQNSVVNWKNHAFASIAFSDNREMRHFARLIRISYAICDGIRLISFRLSNKKPDKNVCIWNHNSTHMRPDKKEITLFCQYCLQPLKRWKTQQTLYSHEFSKNKNKKCRRETKQITYFGWP